MKNPAYSDLSDSMASAERILLVDDEPDVGDMLRLFFTWKDYNFYYAEDGRTALDMAARVMPHVILMDAMLPDTDGFQVTTQLRRLPRTAHIPVIFLTRWNRRDRRLTALALGADDFVPKPFDISELLLRVQNTIARAARDHFTDLRTGLPAVFTARERLTQARRDPSQAIIELTITHAVAFQVAFGSAAYATVRRSLGSLLLDVLNAQGRLEDFVGYSDEDQFVIITAADEAETVVAQITDLFSAPGVQSGPAPGSPPPESIGLESRITLGEPLLEL